MYSLSSGRRFHKGQLHCHLDSLIKSDNMRQIALLFYSKSCWCDFVSQFDVVCVITSEPEAKSFKCLGNSVVNFERERDKLLQFSRMTKLLLKLARKS